MSENQENSQSAESILKEEFPNLLDKVDKKYHEYIESIVKNPIRQFQKSSVDEYLKLIEEKGLGVALGHAFDARDYTKGNTWEQAQMNVMNSILPQTKESNEIFKKAIEEDVADACKWFPEVNGNPKEIKECLEPKLKSEDDMCRYWAAIHLSKHGPDVENLADVLAEGLSKDWIAYKLEHSSSGITGKGECAKALARLSDKAKPALEELEKQLSSETIDAADSSHISGALFHLTKDVNKTLALLANVAERVLKAKRGFSIHSGDKDMLNSLKNMIERWKKLEDKDESLEEKITVLESEIKYHLS